MLTVERPLWRRKMRSLVFLVKKLKDWFKGKICRDRYRALRWAAGRVRRYYKYYRARMKFLSLLEQLRGMQRFWFLSALTSRGSSLLNRASNFRLRLTLNCLPVIQLYRQRVLHQVRVEAFAAARTGDVERFQELLHAIHCDEVGVCFRCAAGSIADVLSLRDRSCGYASLIHVAARSGNHLFIGKFMELCAEHGTTHMMTAGDGLGRNALHVAVEQGDAYLGTVNFLVAEYPQLLEGRDIEGRTPAMYLRALEKEQKDEGFYHDMSFHQVSADWEHNCTLWVLSTDHRKFSVLVVMPPS